MRYTITTMAEISKNNSRLCLSAKRALGICWQCTLYNTCESKIVNKDYEADMLEISNMEVLHRERIDEIRQKWVV